MALSSLQNFVADAVDIVEFALVRDADDMEDEEIRFSPMMAHQIFGEKEIIFGYRDLKINIFYSAGPLDMYYNISYSKKVDDINSEGIKADDISKALEELVEDGCCYTNLNEFLDVTSKKNKAFKPFGEKIDEFEITEGSSTSVGKKFEVYLCDMHTPGFLKFHSRFEDISYWFIDAFSRIEVDPLWKYFVVYEKYKNKDGDERYASAGYSTVYQYYSHPSQIRPRISQIMILPPFQKMGIASRLIEHTLHKHFVSMSSVSDITYEDPTDVIQHIRSVYDAKRCKGLPSFSNDNLKKGFSKAMLQDAKDKFKINPKQCRVIYEILRLGVTNTKNEADYKAYRIEVKKRLNMNYSKHRRDLMKASKRGCDVTAAMAGLPSLDERMESLKGEYQNVEEIYQQVLKKVNCF